MSYIAEFQAYLGEAIARVPETEPSSNHVIRCPQELNNLFDTVAISGEHSEAGLVLNLHWKAIAAGLGQASEALEADTSDRRERILHFTAE